MIVDTSALLAILRKEAGWNSLYEQVMSVPILLMLCGTLQDLLIVALRKGILATVDELLSALDFDYVPVDTTLARCGVELYRQYGKGTGHPAQLNYGDCFAAALATVRHLPLLYAGEDFKAAGF
jgi:ribonuclease VapC